MLYLGALFLAKVLDNALSTTKTILIQRSRWVLAGIAVILSDFLYFWITKGIAALYYYYCYELHILVRFPASAPRLSAAMRQDLRKLDRLDAQTRFLAENQIETAADLDAYRERAGHEITALTAERTDLRNKLKRTVRTGDEAAVMEGKLQIAAISGKIMKLQENLKTCDSAQKRAEEIQAQLEALHDERKEKTDELFGRSSGTGREDEPQRR